MNEIWMMLVPIFCLTTALARDSALRADDLSAWRAPTGEWLTVGKVQLQSTNDNRFALVPGDGVLVNGKEGRTVDLLTREEFGDVEVHIEFCIARRSNSGVYLMGRYEVQIYDSHGVTKDKYPGIECGGIYPRWTAQRGEYAGHSPRVNASKPAGEWQSFDIVFRAPRFDAAGKKTHNARFEKVVHNGQTVHENVELTGPTRAARWETEAPVGPLLLQGDHGPVAFRNIKIRLLPAADSARILRPPLPIVPLPAESRFTDEKPFRITPATIIVCDSHVNSTAARAVEALRLAAGLTLKLVSSAPARDNIVLRIDTGLFAELPEWQRTESYRLAVGSSAVELSAPSPHGLFNGLQTLAQLVEPTDEGNWQIRACEAKDYPRFQWRGLLLDPARHFLAPDYLKKFIEVMAFYKYNRLQLHLTDDQGWRIEIKRYPRLTEIGSIRRQSPKRGDRGHGDGHVYGPFFYRQDQIRELVAYAKARHVTLVPEFEIPGHFGAAIAAHPEFSCAGKPSEVKSLWGINADVLCPGNDAAIAFARDVLGEICELFPSEFIHIGGDEVPRDRWKTCARCQARMKAECLKNEAQLQTWLNHRLEEFLVRKSRRMIGWDEILEGGLTPGAVVMSWRGSQGGIDAAKAEHDVIMSPTTHCYFDYAQASGPNEPECIGGLIPLTTVYSFDPEPAELSPSQRRHILGAQGNIWGEYIRDGQDVEYFAFPRALALAELNWSPVAGRSFEEFSSRLDAQYRLLDRIKVNYRKPDVETTRCAPKNKAEIE